MTYERIVGLDVTDEGLYEQYRAGMKPILAEYGGQFGFDLRVSEVLLAPGNARINRVFTIAFPDKAAMEAFFADERYKQVQSALMAPAVASRTIISLHYKDN